VVGGRVRGEWRGGGCCEMELLPGQRCRPMSHAAAATHTHMHTRTHTHTHTHTCARGGRKHKTHTSVTPVAASVNPVRL
jgi:hypothetical protein